MVMSLAWGLWICVEAASLLSNHLDRKAKVNKKLVCEDNKSNKQTINSFQQNTHIQHFTINWIIKLNSQKSSIKCVHMILTDNMSKLRVIQRISPGAQTFAQWVYVQSVPTDGGCTYIQPDGGCI